MKRYPAFDPPEYVNWAADPDLVAEYADTLERDPARKARIETLDGDALLALYAGMVRNRLHDITLKRWVRTGVISKAWLGTGEEAVTIGGVHALEPDDVVAPMIRNAGACHEKGMPVADMLRGYLATADSPNAGRDVHYGDLPHNVIGPISHLGAMVPVMTGVALSFKLAGTTRIGMTWVGDGSTKTGEFYEGMNLASQQSAPLIIVIQNNQVALGTMLAQHHHGSFTDWPRAFGVRGASFDGNNVLDAYAATAIAADLCRIGHGPVLLSCETFRMGGHATHDEREARETFPAELFERWGRRDPIGLYEEYLVSLGCPRERLAAVETVVEREIEAAENDALASREKAMPVPSDAARGVYHEVHAKSQRQ
ncbi:MAG TPA: thiamine pyrophosphate-dependent dehydrogenase E1 component subunit alpha [Blastocatellia bacterium]|nr:thiamine pyrophosphate-dependent dehydrogenase E1 component subunit alpha [Blastocatellia bacterium]